MPRQGKQRAGAAPDGARARGKKPGWNLLEMAAWGRARLAADDADQKKQARLRYEDARKNYAGALDVIVQEYEQDFPWPTGPKSWTVQESKDLRVGPWDRADEADDLEDSDPSKKKQKAAPKRKAHATHPPEEKTWAKAKAECALMSAHYYEFQEVSLAWLVAQSVSV